MLFKYHRTIGLCIATPFLLLLVIALAGGGHGSFVPVITLFPFAALANILKWGAGTLVISLAAVQLPIYGIILDMSKARGKFKLALIALVFIHIVAAVCSAILFAKRF